MKHLLALTLLLIPFLTLQAQDKPEEKLSKHFKGLAEAIKANPKDDLAATKALAAYHTANRKDVQTQVNALTTSWDNITDKDKKSDTVETFLKSFETQNKEFITQLNNHATKIHKTESENIEAQKIFSQFNNQFAKDLSPIGKYAKTYAKPSSTPACQINLKTLQKCVRAIQNLTGLNEGDPLTWDMIIGPDKPIQEKLKCPSGGTYTILKTIPPIGTPACSCDHPGHQIPKEKTKAW